MTSGADVSLPADSARPLDSPAHPDGNTIGFLDLPLELRLMIYELLLVDPDPVIISPRRRQIHARVCTRPATNANTYLRARRPTPEKFLEQKEDRLDVSILRTCRQVNFEGTGLLYGKNSFSMQPPFSYPVTVTLEQDCVLYHHI